MMVFALSYYILFFTFLMFGCYLLETYFFFLMRDRKKSRSGLVKRWGELGDQGREIVLLYFLRK